MHIHTSTDKHAGISSVESYAMKYKATVLGLCLMALWFRLNHWKHSKV